MTKYYKLSDKIVDYILALSDEHDYLTEPIWDEIEKALYHPIEVEQK